MDVGIHKKYEEEVFSDQLGDMFADLVAEKDVRFVVLRFIAQTIQDNRRKNMESLGVTINDIIQGVRLYRTKRKAEQGTYTYISVEDHITRKSAEQVVEQLSLMSLIYSVPVGPSKMLFVTTRGIQVLTILLARKGR